MFDQGNRIKSATGKETYTYDGFGRRVQELAADGTKLIQTYGSEGQLLMASQTGGGKPAKDTKYVYLNRHLLAEIEVAGTTTVSYNHTDALGSPISKTNAAGVRTALTKYEPYGMPLTGSTTPTIGFTGHVNDADTGLVYMQQRYYDPLAGRLLSMDPVLTDVNAGLGFNRYAYANNSPYRYVDPDGRFAFLIPLVPYIATATVAIVGHYVAPGRQGREDSARRLGNAIFNHGNTDGTKQDGNKNAGGANSASLPPGGPDGDENNREKTVDEKRAQHIFRDKEGHLPDTPSNRNLLNDVANNPRNRVSVDKYGNEWFAKIDANGNQVWAQVRGDRIINGGVNNPPRTPNAGTGLSAPSAPGWK